MFLNLISTAVEKNDIFITAGNQTLRSYISNGYYNSERIYFEFHHFIVRSDGLEAVYDNSKKHYRISKDMITDIYEQTISLISDHYIYADEKGGKYFEF